MTAAVTDLGRPARRFTVAHNVVANVLGRGWTALMLVVTVPLYVRLLGIEAYGLIGFHATLLGILLVLDFGLGTAVNRELAAISANAADARSPRDLLRTLELVYWGVAVAIGAAVAVAAPFISRAWLGETRLPQSDVTAAVQMMGLAIALQWPFALYQGGLLGLQRQVELNVLRIAGETLRALGAVAVLMLFTPTLRAFFLWQSVAAAAMTLAAAWSLWRGLPRGTGAARFRSDYLRQLMRFALSMTAVSVLSIVITQLDKVVLSRLVSLSEFGYYTLATTIAALMTQAVSPFFAAVFPRLVSLVAAERRDELASLYHTTTQTVIVFIAPAAVTLAFFARPLIHFWTGDSAAAAGAGRFASILAAGYLLHALMQLPYALQLAHRWTKVLIWQNICAAVALVPVLTSAVRVWGADGAAITWMLMNLLAVLISAPIVHRVLMPGELWKWYRDSVIAPVLVAAAVVGAVALMVNMTESRLLNLAVIVSAAAAATVACALTAPMPRQWVLLRIRRSRQ